MIKSVRFRRLRLWWMRQHARSRLWPFCWDCRLAQEAWCRGEFYAHDEPMWFLEECMAKAEPVEIILPPIDPNLVIGPPDWKVRPATKTWTERTKLWIS